MSERQAKTENRQRTGKQNKYVILQLYIILIQLHNNSTLQLLYNKYMH